MITEARMENICRKYTVEINLNDILISATKMKLKYILILVQIIAAKTSDSEILQEEKV